MKHLHFWLIGGIVALGGAFCLGCLIVALFYLEEDWRGARAWADCQSKLADKGEVLDLHQLIPPGKPEDDLSKLPIFADLYVNTAPMNARLRQVNVYLTSGYQSQADGPKLSGYKKGQALDLAAWQKYYRASPDANLPISSRTPAQDVLQVLSRFDGTINEVDTAVSNPNGYFPIDYEMPARMTLGPATSMVQLAKLLSLRGAAHLEDRHADLAEKDYQFSFRVNQPLSKGCFMVNYLIIVGVRAIDDSILWEGLHRHAWTDNQLRAMESTLAASDLLASGADSLRAERGYGLQTAKALLQDREELRKTVAIDINQDDGPGKFETLLFLEMRPSGWADWELVAHAQYVQKRIEAIHLNEGTLVKRIFAEGNELKNAGAWAKLNSFMSRFGLGSLDGFGFVIARAETYRRLARLACRLEEFRLAHGQYPEKLEALPDLPTHLNQEVLSEDPLRYQRKGEGYLLYSVGWNQTDDEGMMTKDEKEGDWPWPSP